MEQHHKTTVMVVYGPGEDEKIQVKEEFWEQVNEEIEKVTGRLLLIGDLNARVEKKDEETLGTIGSHGEEVVNNFNSLNEINQRLRK